MAVSCNSGIYDSQEGQCYEAPYEEISHEIDNNFLSIKVLKDIGQIEGVHGNGNRAGTTPSNSVRVNCTDASGNTYIYIFFKFCLN